MVDNLVMIEYGLIPVYTNEEEQVRYVNARILHERLGIGRKFTSWIQDRIAKYDFVEDIDFFSFMGESTGGRPSTEYALTIETAKEIAMVQNNEQGREVRRYFIEIENKYKQHILEQLKEAKALDRNLVEAKQAVILADKQADVAISKIKEYTKAYGIPKSEASLIVHKAKIEGTNPDIVVNELLKVRRAKELMKKRNRIYVRMQSLGSVFKELYHNLELDPYEHAWHELANELRMDLGHTVNWRTRHERDKERIRFSNNERGKGVKKEKAPGYLDYVAEDGCYLEAERAATRLLKKYQKKLDTVRQKRNENKIVDEVWSF